MSAQATSVTLRARMGAPLADAQVRDTVIASAHAIGERTGVTIGRVQTTDDSVQVSLDADRIGAIGFAAELRRVTNAWHARKFGVTLWGEDPEEAA